MRRDVGTHQEGDDVLVDVLQHGLEQVERLELVDDQRVFLLVGGVLHRFLQVVEFAEVFLPGVVDEAEGDALLDAEVHLAGTVLDSLLQVDDDVHAALTVGDRDGDVLEVVLVLVHVLDDGQGLLADDAGLLAIVLKGGIEELLGQFVGLASVKLFLAERRLDAHGGEQLHLEAFVVFRILVFVDELLAEVVHHVVEVDGETLSE